MIYLPADEEKPDTIDPRTWNKPDACPLQRGINVSDTTGNAVGLSIVCIFSGANLHAPGTRHFRNWVDGWNYFPGGCPGLDCARADLSLSKSLDAASIKINQARWTLALGSNYFPRPGLLDTFAQRGM